MRLVLVLLIALLLPACERQPRPSNHVAILIDASGSYRARQAEAVQKAAALLDSMASVKLQRWERATDHLAIISLDAMPEVIWEGTLQDLRAMDPSAWTSRFQARRDYAQCTDVDAAFHLAASHVAGDPRYIRKYLFVFSDLVHEPPTDSLRTCRQPARPSVPGEGFPWRDLADVSVSAFWVPPDQKLAWSHMVREQGLVTFQIYTTAESAAVTIIPPPRPVRMVTEAEQAADRAQILELAWRATTWVGTAALAGMVLLGLLAIGIGAAKRRQRKEN